MTSLQRLGIKLMTIIRSIIATVTLCSLLVACSSTTSDVRQIIDTVDRSSIQGLKLAVGGEGIQLSSQTRSSIFTLHQNSEEVMHVARLVAQRYGFSVLEKGDISQITSLNTDLAAQGVEGAEFYLKVLSAVPDGGSCLKGFDSAAKNLSFTGSVLTLGVAPASTEHCLVVEVELYHYEDSQPVLIGGFSSNLGRVELYAGANEIDNYQLNVDKRDEIKSLEVTFGGLLNTMLADGAFVQKRNDTYYF